MSSLIARVEALPLRVAAQADDLDGSNDTVVVRITDADGRTGIGEADAPAQAVAALILRDDAHTWSRGMAGLLLGRDPVEVGARWDELAAATFYDGNAGLSRHALAAVDIALHDLAGKQLGRPAHALLGGARRDRLSVYATLYRAASASDSAAALHEELEALLDRAVQDGYRAVKYEAIYPGSVSDAEVVALVTRARAVAGDELELLVDFGYRWRDWRDALWTLNRLEPARLWLAEATLPDGDLDSHAKLAARVETRIGGAELASTVAECRAWLERGRVDVLQPDVARCGGLSEMRRVVDLAALHGASVVPHCWKTGINAAAARHLHAAALAVPMIEVLPPELFDSPLRRELVRPEPVLEDGTLPLPDAPGLGVELVDAVVDRHRWEAGIA
jgi:L-alanine-DL-glutamate epimerase-like enolase superfamily enzyme